MDRGKRFLKSGVNVSYFAGIAIFRRRKRMMNTGKRGTRGFLSLVRFFLSTDAKRRMFAVVDVKDVAKLDMKRKFAVVN
jgi:hypothetical protein